MPRLNRNRRHQPTQSIRVTRSRSRLNNAPNLMTGLDQRGRPVDPLSAEPHNLTADQVLKAWLDEEKQRMEQRELEQQRQGDSRNSSAFSISTLSPPPPNILSGSPPPNISRLLDPTRTPSNAPTPQTQADDNQKDVDVSGQLSVDGDLPTHDTLDFDELNNGQNEDPTDTVVPDARINDLSPEFAIFRSSLSPASNGNATPNNAERLPGPSSRVPLSELNQNDLNSRHPTIQARIATDWDPDQSNESSHPPPSDQENIGPAPSNPNTQSDEQSNNSSHDSQTSNGEGNQDSSGSSGSNGSNPSENLFAPLGIPSASRLPPDWRPGRPDSGTNSNRNINSSSGNGSGNNSSNGSNEPSLRESLFAPLGIPSASGLPPDWRPGRQGSGANINPEISSRSESRSESGGSSTTTSSEGESTERDDNQGNRGNRDDSPGPDSTGAQLRTQRQGAPSPEESPYPQRSHGTQTEGPCRRVTHKRRRSDDDEDAGTAPQTKRHASGGNQTSEDTEQNTPRPQWVSSSRASGNAEENPTKPGNIFDFMNHTNAVAERSKVEIPGEIPGQYGTSIRPRMNYDWWEQYHIFGLDCIRVHKCPRGICHECHAKWQNNWAKYFKEEEELQIASEDPDHSVQVVPEQILKAPMGKSLRMHPVRAAKQRLLEQRAR